MLTYMYTSTLVVCVVVLSDCELPTYLTVKTTFDNIPDKIVATDYIIF